MKRITIVALLVLASCGEPKQSGRITVQPGADTRAAWIASRGRKPREHSDALPSKVDVQPVDVGDTKWEKLTNGLVTFTIGPRGIEGAGAGPQGMGGISLKPWVGDEEPPLASKIDAHVEGGLAYVELAGAPSLAHEGLTLTTRYTLHAGDRALLIESTIRNGTQAPLTVSAGDVILWGDALPFASGKEEGFLGASDTPFLGGIDAVQSYGITSTDGSIEANTRLTRDYRASTTTHVHDVKLAAGASQSYARVLVIGVRPDSSSVVTELTLASGGPVGAIDYRTDESAKTPLVIATRAGTPVMTMAATDGHFRGELPVGAYRFEYAGRAVDVDVRADAVASGSLTTK